MLRELQVAISNLRTKLTSEQLSALYGSHVDVVRVHGRILVVGELTDTGFNLDEPHHVPALVGHEQAHD